jgi:hypothetical protein
MLMGVLPESGPFPAGLVSFAALDMLLLTVIKVSEPRSVSNWLVARTF